MAAHSGPSASKDFRYNSLLLSGNGVNGTQNNTFIDSSSNNFTMTRVGNAAQGTFSPFSLPEGQWSNYFDGTGDYLSVPNNAALQFGTGNFTIEGWFYPSSVSGYCSLFSIGAYSSGILVRAGGSGFTGDIYINGTQVNINWNSAGAFAAGRWNHLAFVRQGTACNLYCNGTSVASFTSSANIAQSADTYIGISQHNAGEIYTGYISNFRMIKGTAVYTSNFTVPTSALTAISGTSLLTCQSNRFKDNSSNNFTVTPAGDTKVTVFSPFEPGAPYIPAINGGSAYFDGSGDGISFTNSAWGTSDFTVEMWFYQTAITNEGLIDCRGGGSDSNPGFVLYFWNNIIYYSGGQGVRPSANEWHHIAVCRSGTSMKLFVDGVQSGTTGTNNVNYSNAYTSNIGIFGDLASYAFSGYISNARIIVGSALYTSNFTPPTAPLTAVSGTQLLLNCVNAGIYDNSGKNDIETVGDVQISTSVKKYGTGSMYFDGTGDYLNIAYNPVFDFGAGDFTIEGWVYLNAINSSYYSIIDARPTGSAATCYALWIQNGRLGLSVNASDVIAPTTGTQMQANTWNHFAYVRNGGNTVTTYLNGVSQNTWNSSGASVNSNGIVIAYKRFTGSSLTYLNGYLDDLRITKGLARYTSDFDPPSYSLKLR